MMGVPGREGNTLNLALWSQGPESNPVGGNLFSDTAEGYYTVELCNIEHPVDGNFSSLCCNVCATT